MLVVECAVVMSEMPLLLLSWLLPPFEQNSFSFWEKFLVVIVEDEYTEEQPQLPSTTGSFASPLAQCNKGRIKTSGCHQSRSAHQNGDDKNQK